MWGWLLSGWRVRLLLLFQVYLASWGLDHWTDTFIENWTCWAPPVRRGSAVFMEKIPGQLLSGWKVVLLLELYLV